uniref:(northern house mosquito) hypothetical protein n=1 Tax=Culex pipiens TaxID=7175 RepID=A0A8D7ZUW1_CULPI
MGDEKHLKIKPDAELPGRAGVGTLHRARGGRSGLLEHPGNGQRGGEGRERVEKEAETEAGPKVQERDHRGECGRPFGVHAGQEFAEGELWRAPEAIERTSASTWTVGLRSTWPRMCGCSKCWRNSKSMS